mgnify:FL=1
MKHIKTINAANLKASAAKGGCGKCQACLLYTSPSPRDCS